MTKNIFLGIFILVIGFGISCTKQSSEVSVDLTKVPYQTLSEYHFFSGDIKELKPNAKVLNYELITPLFTDYAHKSRFVCMPKGTSAKYNKEITFDFPEGAVLIKNFFYENDERDISKGRRIIETRLLIKNTNGWQAYTYVWNDAQTDAKLEIAGDTKPVSWIDANGKKHEINYAIPNKNQCKGCHNFSEKVMPIGPKARNINSEIVYGTEKLNQLQKWTNEGYLTGYNSSETHPKVAKWDDSTSGSVHDRAMAYLDVNCGHCHNPNGPGGTSGLTLVYNEKNPEKFGVCKSPVAAGRGSGGFLYDIMPGHAESSILYYRTQSTDPGEMMPEVGRTVAHEEGLTLLKQWINSMQGSCGKQ